MYQKVNKFIKIYLWCVNFFLVVVFFAAFLLPSPAVWATSSTALQPGSSGGGIGGISARQMNQPSMAVRLESCFENGKPSSVIASDQLWSKYLPSIFKNRSEAISYAKSCARAACGSENNLCCSTFCSMSGSSDDSMCMSNCLGIN